MIVVSVSEQRLIHRYRGVRRCYPVSTARAGAGNRRNSLMTPLGRHRIYAKIGAGLPPWTVFRARQPIGLFDDLDDGVSRDWILSRILWLEGCQTGVNRRGACDTRARFIYIHGTNEESLIGQPVSHGCIRMRNWDIMELFDRVRVGETVLIRP
ncbi:MAG: L,D-transpeptidase [Zetaproteobacteria bacterium]|nr:MAG: L,D-transpeptidase [Zetaproteobacteria bacterium]